MKLKKMTNKFIIFILLFTQLTCFAQDMNKGLDILKKLETKFNKTQNIKGEVEYVTSSVNTQGLFYVKGNSFLIKSDKIEIINNNKENCVIYPEYKEITLTKNNHSVVFFPFKNFINFCINECKSKHKEEKGINIIDIYPNPNIKSKYRKIEIKTKNTEIKSIKLFHKNGLEEDIYFSNIKYSEKIPDSLFTINKYKYKDFEITDLR